MNFIKENHPDSKKFTLSTPIFTDKYDSNKEN